MAHIYDTIIIGGGPGGFTAALYCARAGLNTLILEKLSPGGQMALTHQIENYPGFPERTDGVALGQRMRQGAENSGAKILLTEVLSLMLQGNIKEVKTAEESYFCRSMILATGAEPRTLGVPGEQTFTGRGVSYCAACDGRFYAGKTVAVVGGGNTAATDALLLSRICKKVILIHRRDSMRAANVYQKLLEMAENVEFRWNSTVISILGDDRLTGASIRVDGKDTRITCDGVFVCIGRTPATKLVQGQLELDASGYVRADETTRTNIPGVFAVGDVRTKPLRQIVTATADGATACHFVEAYLANTS